MVEVDTLEQLPGIHVGLGQLGVDGIGLVAPHRVDRGGEQHHRGILELGETHLVLLQVQGPDAGLLGGLAAGVGVVDVVRRGELVGLFELRPDRQRIRLAEALATPAAPRVAADLPAGLRVERQHVPAEGVEALVVRRIDQRRHAARHLELAQRLGVHAAGGVEDGDVRVLHVVFARQQLGLVDEHRQFPAIRAQVDGIGRLGPRAGAGQVGAEHFLAAIQVDAGNALPAVMDDIGDLAVARCHQRAGAVAHGGVGDVVGLHHLARLGVDQQHQVRARGGDQIVPGRRHLADQAEGDGAQGEGHAQGRMFLLVHMTSSSRKGMDHLGKTACSFAQSWGAESLPVLQSG
ncbi:hypothetical protein D9M71_357590 [compost metagenome]